MYTLLDDYKRKLATAEKMLKDFSKRDQPLNDGESMKRISIKASEYRSFIVDIERAIERTKNKLP